MTLNIDQYIGPDGDDSEYIDSPNVPTLQRHNVRIKPLILELQVLTKDRGQRRLGEVINAAQEDFVDEVERQINQNGMVRIVVLKARQMGISTIIEAILFVLSILYENFQSLIISHENDSAEHILGMTKRYWETYPFRDYHVEKYSARKQLSWSDLNSNMVIATAKNTGAGRSKTLHGLHASEVGFWDKPHELTTGLRQAIPSFGLTAIFYESTANGVGNFFHDTWLEAESGNSEFVPKFYAWFMHPEYTSSYIPGHEQVKYSQLGRLDEDEMILRSMGVNVQRLLWRRWAIVNLCGNDLDKFKQEYPSTATEAFLTTGRNVFRLPDLLRHYHPTKPKVGYLSRVDGNVTFIEHHSGPLKVYQLPSADRNWGVYQVGADPTHTTVGDMACAQVISRRTLNQVAVFRKHMDPTSFGRECALLGEFYNMAQIAPEKEGPGYATVGYLVGMNYSNIFESQKVDKTPGKVNHDVFGWGTNSSTKHYAISRVVDLCAQSVQMVEQSPRGLIIRDEDTFNEMKNYVVNEKGEFMNGNGTKFDDTVMALAIACATHFIEPPLVVYSPDRTVHEQAAQVLRAMPTGNRPPDQQTAHIPIEQPDNAPWELE